MRKIGINFQQFRELSDEDFVKKIAELGFGATFCMLEPVKRQEELANLFVKYNIECETLHAPFNHINDMWLDCEGGERMLAELKDCVDHCVIANASAMVVHLSSGPTPPSITDIGRGRYEKLVDYAIKKNVKIAFENQRKTANLAWAMETFDDEPMAGFCWDCGHEACAQNGREFMPWYGKKLICTHIHDNRGIQGADDHWIPFDGVINFERFAQHIHNSGFTGSFMLEVGKSSKYDDLSVEVYLEKAACAVKRLVEMEQQQ